MKALLAPVPAIHIEDGEDVFAKHGTIAYGSNSSDLFEALQTIKSDENLPVLIYASKTDSEHLGAKYALCKIVSVATLSGVERSQFGKHVRPEFRPKRALETDQAFAFFWEIKGLNRLKKPATLDAVRKLGPNSKAGGRLDGIAHRPILVKIIDDGTIFQ